MPQPEPEISNPSTSKYPSEYLPSVAGQTRAQSHNPQTFVNNPGQLIYAHSTVFLSPAVIGLFNNTDLSDPINTSTCRNFETISSGFGLLFAILGPPFPKHKGGPVQLGRLMFKSLAKTAIYANDGLSARHNRTNLCNTSLLGYSTFIAGLRYRFFVP